MGFAKMPIYEYECPECHKIEESWLGVNAVPSICYTFTKLIVKKVSAPAIQFKGSGFYETDYKEKK